jgi:hypothetical protein
MCLIIFFVLPIYFIFVGNIVSVTCSGGYKMATVVHYDSNGNQNDLEIRYFKSSNNML